MSRSNPVAGDIFLVRLLSAPSSGRPDIKVGQIRKVLLECTGGIYWMLPKDYVNPNGLVILCPSEITILQELTS